MFRQSIKTVGILLRYAKSDTLLKLLQLLISAAMTPLGIWFMQQLIDSVSRMNAVHGFASSLSDSNPAGVSTYFFGLLPPDSTPLFIWGSLLLASLFFSATSGFFDSILFIRIRRRLMAGLAPVLAEKFKRLEYACFEDRDVQDTITRMSDNPQDHLFNLFLNLTGFFTLLIGVIGSSLLFSQIGWWFTAVFLILLLPMSWFDFKAADMMNTMFNNQSTDERRMHDLGGLLSTKSSLAELKAFQATGYVERKWNALARKVLDTRLATTLSAQRQFLASTLLFKIWSFFMMLVLVNAIVEGHITIGLFTALVASTGTILGQTNLMSHSLQNIRSRFLLIGHYERFLDLPEIPVASVRETGVTSISRSSAETRTASSDELEHCSTPTEPSPLHVSFVDVSFRYPGTDKQILDGVTFDINPNERIALVGVNGAGKSTLIKLLCGLYRPDGGRILLNGQDLETMDKALRQRVFSVVFQDFCRYELTVRENVAFGNIARLQDDAHLIASLRQGLSEGLTLDTHLGKLEENGIDLSGGQWQRLAIARACAADSAFVILDEPTASLDPLAESWMYQSFSEVLKNRGCILISHRLASARMADRILVLDGGKITESGHHDTLMAKAGLYARMFESQSAWYRDTGNGQEAEGGVTI